MVDEASPNKSCSAANAVVPGGADAAVTPGAGATRPPVLGFKMG